VVGRAHCTRFGTWDSRRIPPTLITMGSTLHFFPMRGLRFSGVAQHDTAMRYALRGEQTGDQAAALTWDMRTTMGLGRWLYAGAESQVGKLYLDGTPLAMQDDLVIDPAGSLYASAGVVAGIRVPLGGDLELRAEAVGGVRVVSLTVHSQHLDCQATSAVADIEPLLETRIAAATWLSPWLSIGAAVGGNALQRGDVTAGVFLDGHLRAFDGGR
jgi:hypothetical protein